MSRAVLEVADIFRGHGPAWRQANVGHVSLGQLKVMAAIESCRMAALGGHVTRCENAKCGYTQIAYNSCRNRHCPKCQSAAAREWLAEREAELLPVPYFHVVFSLPRQIADIAYHNKAVIYDILFKASAGGSCRYCIAAFNHLTDLPAPLIEREALPTSILLFRWRAMLPGMPHLLPRTTAKNNAVESMIGIGRASKYQFRTPGERAGSWQLIRPPNPITAT
jgi:hypothetical protein